MWRYENDSMATLCSTTFGSPAPSNPLRETRTEIRVRSPCTLFLLECADTSDEASGNAWTGLTPSGLMLHPHFGAITFVVEVM